MLCIQNYDKRYTTKTIRKYHFIKYPRQELAAVFPANDPAGMFIGKQLAYRNPTVFFTRNHHHPLSEFNCTMPPFSQHHSDLNPSLRLRFTQAALLIIVPLSGCSVEETTVPSDLQFDTQGVFQIPASIPGADQAAEAMTLIPDAENLLAFLEELETQARSSNRIALPRELQFLEEACPLGGSIRINREETADQILVQTQFKSCGITRKQQSVFLQGSWTRTERYATQGQGNRELIQESLNFDLTGSRSGQIVLVLNGSHLYTANETTSGSTQINRSSDRIEWLDDQNYQATQHYSSQSISQVVGNTVFTSLEQLTSRVGSTSLNGYVDINLLNPIRSESDAECPDQGTIKLTGSNQAWIRFGADAGTSAVLIEVDSGATDWRSCADWFSAQSMP
jgi:hypothetical protein